MSQNESKIDQIIEGSWDYCDGETSADDCIEKYCLDNFIDAETMKRAQKESFKRGALEAGIPLSVIEGRTKLKDHFSQDYIDSQTEPLAESEWDADLFTVVDGIVFKK